MHKRLICSLIIGFILLSNSVALNAQNKGIIDSLKRIIYSDEVVDKISAYNQLGWQYRKVFPDSSLYFLNNALELTDLTNDQRLLPETYNFLGVAYLYKGDYLNSYDYHDKAKDEAIKMGDSLQIAHALNSLGRLYEGTAAYDKAIEYYNQALEIFKKLDDRIGLSYIYSSLATFYQSQKSYVKAEEMSKKSLQIRKDLDLWAGVAFSYLELAKIYSDAMRSDLAFETLKKAQQYSDSVRANLVLKAEVNTEISNQFRKRGNYEDSKKVMEVAKEIAEGIANQNLFMKVYNEYGQLSYDLGNYDRAIYYHNKVVERAENSAFWDELRQGYLNLSKDYEAKGDLKNAYKNFKLYNEMEIKFLDTEKARLVQQHESRIALETRAKENELLKIEKQKNEELLAEQNIRNLALIGLVMVLIILVISFMFYSIKRRKDNRVLLEQKDKLSNINLQKDTLMNILAHDLKAPFNRIIGLVDLMKVDKDNEDQYVKMIDQMSHSGVDLIKNILEVNRLETGEVSENINQVDIKNLLAEKILHYKEDAQQKNIKLETDIQVDQLFVTNQLYLERIIENLISNAIKYTPKEGEVSVRVSLKENLLKLSVADQGPGFTEDDKKHLYTKFKTLSAKPTGGEASNGLGLSLVKTLVEKLKGSINLQSEIGKGSTFEVVVPQLS